MASLPLRAIRDAQVFGCHHPMIAPMKHKIEMPVCMLISIQYRIGAVSRCKTCLVGDHQSRRSPLMNVIFLSTRPYQTLRPQERHSATATTR